jgi:hypothetical protein
MNIFDEIDQHFLSGNDVPVTSIIITRELWVKLKSRHDSLSEFIDKAFVAHPNLDLDIEFMDKL